MTRRSPVPQPPSTVRYTKEEREAWRRYAIAYQNSLHPDNMHLMDPQGFARLCESFANAMLEKEKFKFDGYDDID
jgi:hypothetical protein